MQYMCWSSDDLTPAHHLPMFWNMVMSSGMYFCFPRFFWQGTALAIFLAASEPNALGRG